MEKSPEYGGPPSQQLEPSSDQQRILEQHLSDWESFLRKELSSSQLSADARKQVIVDETMRNIDKFEDTLSLVDHSEHRESVADDGAGNCKADSQTLVNEEVSRFRWEMRAMNQETAEWFRLEFVILHRRLDELAKQISRIQPQHSRDESAGPSKMVPSPLRLTRPSAPPPPAHVVKLSSLSNGSPLLRPDGKPRGPRGPRGEREIRLADQRMTLKSPSLSSRQEMETETNAAIPTTASVPVELWQRTHPAFRTPSRQRESSPPKPQGRHQLRTKEQVKSQKDEKSKSPRPKLPSRLPNLRSGLLRKAKS